MNEPWEQLSQIFSSVTSTLYLLVKLRSDLRFDRPNYDNIQICHGGRDFQFQFIALGVFLHSLKKPMFFTEKLRNENKKFSTIIQLATCLLHPNAWHHILICPQNANECVHVQLYDVSNPSYIAFETFSTHFFLLQFNFLF